MFGLVPYNRKGSTTLSVFDDLLNDNFFSMPFSMTTGSNYMSPQLSMKTDIRETETELIFETELPGIKKEEINVKLENKILTISVDRNEELKEENEGYVRRERRSGSYGRSFRVSGVLEEGASAKYEEGILRVTLKKIDKEAVAAEKRITIE